MTKSERARFADTFYRFDRAIAARRITVYVFGRDLCALSKKFIFAASIPRSEAKILCFSRGEATREHKNYPFDSSGGHRNMNRYVLGEVRPPLVEPFMFADAGFAPPSLPAAARNRASHQARVRATAP